MTVAVRLLRVAKEDTRRALLEALDVDETALARTPNGKPYLPGATARFNVSHTYGLGVVALAEEVEVGVDVEPFDGPRRRKVLPGVLSPSERERVAAAEDPVRAFLRCCTRKEALLKAVGCGLRVDLDAVSIDPGGVTLPPGVARDGPWTVVDLDLDGYAGAVAANASAIAVTWR